MAQMIVKPDADGLMKAVAKQKGPPPVHLWNPPFCGPIDMRIARDGTWFYLGTPIGRERMVKLFSSILKREGEDYFLVTPAEKVQIVVDDAPLLVVDVTATGEGRDQVLSFVTKTEDEVVAGPGHAIEMRDRGFEATPYIHVRAGLWALIDRKTFYRLVELGCHEEKDGDSWFGLWSQGAFFPVTRSQDLT
jgi:hypothetical protein